ncbi:MAG: hypothetical protein D6675_10565 [Gemmatimonadetes bacterium]|nr:MAG: hypothetical protein D6675_10565 [Gemmatimonadota bacterium]
MRKTVLFFIMLVVIGGGIYLFTGKFSGVDLGLLQFVFSEDKKVLAELTEQFFEDIRFKDFEKAASYHSQEDQERVNIPKLIERMFKIKPEVLDIMHYEVTDVELDKSGYRARVHVISTVKMLNTDNVKEPEVIIYWQKDDQGTWHMKLESSLKP